MVVEHDSDPNDAAATTRLRKTEAATKRNLDLMSRAIGGPTGDSIFGYVDKNLRREAGGWERRANQLEQELGSRFIDGSADVRAAMVRDWIRNYRQRGDLRPSD